MKMKENYSKIFLENSLKTDGRSVRTLNRTPLLQYRSKQTEKK